MNVLLISTYELGRQPFALASPAAWLREHGHKVAFADLSVSTLPSEGLAAAEAVAISLPMHTATRLATRAVADIRNARPELPICCYGLYAPLNADFLRSLGVNAIIGGEFEGRLLEWVEGLAHGTNLPDTVSLDRLQFKAPDRRGLPGLDRYSRMNIGGERKLVAYTEASRGCKHLCRHCPIVPVYKGTFRVVQPEVVLHDIQAQVEAGAQHVTFGDPDFFNGPGHARTIVRTLHERFPWLTYDVTIKVEHLLKHQDLLPLLRDTGCLFITTAVESVQDEVLRNLDKGHTSEDFRRAASLCREAGLTLSPTFVPFTPWTTIEGYSELLETVRELDLAGNVAPVQLALRLLIPQGSRILELPGIQKVITGFDPGALVYRWRHPDASVDELAATVLRTVHRAQKQRRSRTETFREIWELVHGRPLPEPLTLQPRTTIPYMEEPWYC